LVFLGQAVAENQRSWLALTEYLLELILQTLDFVSFGGVSP
jgi:hypothetical protein